MSIAQSPFLSSYEIGKFPRRRWKATVLGPPSGQASGPACPTLMSSQAARAPQCHGFLCLCWACWSWEVQGTQDLVPSPGTFLLGLKLEAAAKCYWETYLTWRSRHLADDSSQMPKGWWCA